MLVVSHRMEDNKNITADTDENIGEFQIAERAPDLRYGWGKFRPKCLQVFNNPKWFMCFLTIFSTTQGILHCYSVLELKVLDFILLTVRETLLNSFKHIDTRPQLSYLGNGVRKKSIKTNVN